eukprot:Sspe_Gene.12118::Locus_4125_Transcript_1_1_Confidence_1.000_Length_945::g.12118::m.12118
MNVTGRGLNMDEHVVAVAPGDVVADLMRKLGEAVGQPVRRVRLGDEVLPEAQLCSDSGLVADCVVSFETGLTEKERKQYLCTVYRFPFFPPEARGDRVVASRAVTYSGAMLKYVADGLNADPTVVLLAVGNDVHSLAFAADVLRGDEEFMLQVARLSTCALQYASVELMGRKDFVHRAMDTAGVHSLRHASPELKGDKEVVLHAVQLNGLALVHAADHLKADREVVMAAVARNRFALQYASEVLRLDKEVIYVALARSPENNTIKGKGTQHAVHRAVPTVPSDLPPTQRQEPLGTP